MKNIADLINEGLFSSKPEIEKVLNKIGIKDDEITNLGVHGGHALTELLNAIYYIADNIEQFSKYKSTPKAIRDAVNSVLSEGGYSEKLTII